MVFENWKPRASAIGNILTNRPPDLRGSTPDDFLRLETLQTIRETGKNPETGRANKWDDSKQKEYDLLYCIVNKIKPTDELPKGAITWLEEEFDRVFWGRNRILTTKALDKGILNEPEGVDLLSDVDNTIYFKNEHSLSNDWVKGTPDIRADGRIIDIKCSYEMATFRKSELTSLYEWQVKSYLWQDDLTNGEVAFCLVNTPLHHLNAKILQLNYQYNSPSDDDEEWIEIQKQTERNMIFDPIRFKQDYPFYEFLNAESDLYIPSILRVKRFEVELTDSDIEFMKSRSTMAKKWLLEEEKRTIEKIKEFTNREIHESERFSALLCCGKVSQNIELKTKMTNTNQTS